MERPPDGPASPVEVAERAIDARLVPAAITAWGVTAAGIGWECGTVCAVCCAVIGMVALGAMMSGRRHDPTWRAVSVGILSVALIGTGFGAAIAMRVEAVRQHVITDRFGGIAMVTITPVESPRSVGSGRILLRAALIRLAGDEMSGRVVVFASSPRFGQLAPGQPAHFRARIGRPNRRDLTVAVLTAISEPKIDRANLAQRAAQAVRERFAAISRDVLPADQAALLPGLVLGDTASMTPITIAQFRTAGLTHLTAVSGANVTIVCGAVLLSAAVLGPRLAAGFATVTLVAFVIVVQPSASVLRAAVMGSITLLALLTARRRQAIPALSACVIALMMVAPQFAVDQGFALSVSATAALILLAPRWSARLVRHRWPKPLADAICVAMAAQIVTAPLVASISGQFSLVAVLANLAVSTVIAPITVAGTAAAALCLLWPAGAALLIRFTGPALWWLSRTAEVAAGIPGAALTVPTGLTGFLTVGFALGGAMLGIHLYRRVRNRRGEPGESEWVGSEEWRSCR
jgi:competence protein ComEC